VAEQPGLGFAELLRQLRAEARLTQEELAEAAGLSPRSVSDLEQGIHQTARKDTATPRARWAWLSGAQAVRGGGPRAGPGARVLTPCERRPRRRDAAWGRRSATGWCAAAATGAAFFAGREAELKQLDAPRATAAGQMSGAGRGDLGGAGMAGGQDRAAVHWARNVAGRFPDGQLYVNLRGYDAAGAAVTPEE
jgi:DNA-binding XRE family transcriptional regulator